MPRQERTAAVSFNRQLHVLSNEIIVATFRSDPFRGTLRRQFAQALYGLDVLLAVSSRKRGPIIRESEAGLPELGHVNKLGETYQFLRTRAEEREH